MPINDDMADLLRSHAVDQRPLKFSNRATRFLSRPSTRYNSYIGRILSSGRATNQAISSCSCS